MQISAFPLAALNVNGRYQFTVLRDVCSYSYIHTYI